MNKKLQALMGAGALAWSAMTMSNAQAADTIKVGVLHSLWDDGDFGNHAEGHGPDAGG